MELNVLQGNIAQQQTDCIVVNLFQGATEPGGATGVVDSALGGAIRRLIKSGDFSGDADTTALLYTHGELPAPRVLIVGLGNPKKFDLHAARRAAGTAARAVSRLKGVKSFATVVHGGGIGGLEIGQAAQALAEGTLLALYRAPQYRREVKPPTLEQAVIVEFDADKTAAVDLGVRVGQAIAQGVYTARNLVNEPANVINPVQFTRRAETLAEATGLHFTALNEAEMADLGMNILLAVSRGSRNEARFIILEHAPEGHEEEAPLVWVGKGITFDTGGISLKTPGNMWQMKADMSGAAAVVGAMESVAKLGVPRRIIGIAVCVENMPDGDAFRPGDILTGMTGKTAEILNTDAEGRLILADALAFVARYEPTAVIDLATLTGAIGVALGDLAAGLFANDDALQNALLQAAQASGERLWPMPMYDEYKDTIKSDMAEVKNSAARGAGVSASAKFIEHFTEGYPWAHLDIAYMNWVDHAKDPIRPKGATGYGVRLLVELAQSY